MKIEQVKDFLKEKIDRWERSRDNPYAISQLFVYRSVLRFIEGAQEEERRIRAEDPRR